MYRTLKCVFAVLALEMFSLSAAAVPAESLADKCFARRDWKSLNALADSEKELSPRTLSLIANGYWYQSRWGDALKLMKKIEKSYPAGVVPYAQLFMALALERTGKTQEAYRAGLELYGSSEKFPKVRYFAMALLERLSSNVDEKEKWLRRMMAAGGFSSRKAAAINELSRIGRMTPADALELLRYEPLNSTAQKMAEQAPPSPQKNFRLGYAAYLHGKHQTAVNWLSRLGDNGPHGESGTYYLGVALQKLKRSVEAEPLMKKLAWRKDGRYVQRAIGRLCLMIGGKASAAAQADLLNMTKSQDPALASSALYALSQSRSDHAEAAGEDFLKRFPEDSRVDTLRWQRGWKNYLEGHFDEALKNWEIMGKSTAELLYWRAKALEAEGKSAEAAENVEKLLENYPLTLYSFMAKEGGSLEITDDPLPAELTSVPPSELERWGFMTHARMELEGKRDLPSLVSRARLSRWLGQEWEAYRDLRVLLERRFAGPKVPRKVLEILYPQPYRREVEASAKKCGVDPLFVWSVMMQESSFNPTALSHVGATGLMQLMPATAAEEARRIGLKNPNIYSVKNNILLGTSYLARLHSRYERPEWAAAAYNAGGGNVNKWNRLRADWQTDVWIEAIPFGETEIYVKNVLSNYAVYQKLYGKKDDTKTLTPRQESGSATIDGDEAPTEKGAEAAS
ncbi:MAG: transglycosylase SLT domain-containing protein [Pyramidobacter sp.]|jgi:soluble lytic murein transglycosylase